MFTGGRKILPLKIDPQQIPPCKITTWKILPGIIAFEILPPGDYPSINSPQEDCHLDILPRMITPEDHRLIEKFVAGKLPPGKLPLGKVFPQKIAP